MAAGPYRVLLRTPAVRWQALTGLLAQTTQGAGGVGIILVIRSHGGSLPLAGVVVGVLSVAAGLARPVQGRLIDVHGARGLMVLCGVVHPAALAGIVALADAHAPGVALVAAGALAGVTLPPVSQCMRVAWGATTSVGDRTSAYSLVYLTQELSILAGPLLLAALFSAASPSVALVAVAVVACAGTLGFAASLPPGRARGSAAPTERGGAVLRGAGMRVLIGTAVLVGAVIGAIQVGVPTFATAHHAPAASGLLIAALSIGGIAGAAVYGGRRWRPAATTRLLVLLAALTACVAVTILATGLIALGAVLALAGIALNPTLTTISLHVDWHVSPASAAEAFGWLSTGIATGTGGANAIAGVVSRPGHPRPAFVVATVAAALATALVVAARRTLASGEPE
ncbi:MAG: MFS transporter [Solirubrobacteraceae bacterium]